MRALTDAEHDLWENAPWLFVGEHRPMHRVTIQAMHWSEYAVGKQRYRSPIFGQARPPVELPNVKRVSWNRGVDTDAAQCTIQLYNTKPAPIGTSWQTDQEGWYSFARGAVSMSGSWGHEVNRWQRLIAPDRLLRIYAGYGFDPDAIPELDPHMRCYGVYLIDKARYVRNKQLIEVTGRDLTRQLMEHLAFPPVVPRTVYPLRFTPYDTVQTTRTVNSSGYSTPSYADTSNNAWYPGDVSMYGHAPADAFDGDQASYWLSVGNAEPDANYAFEWIEAAVTGTVAGVRLHVKGGPYRVYLSVAAGGWQGTKTVPYSEFDHGVQVGKPNGSAIPFLKSAQVAADDVVEIMLNQPVSGADRIRLTFTNLWNSHVGEFPYRAAVREIRVGTATSSTETVSSRTGNYDDYSQIVRLLCGYGGFYWPADPDRAYLLRSDGVRVSRPPATVDGYLGGGVVWGDIQRAGTFGPSPLGSEIFALKPLLDGIAYVRDILGHWFWVDEEGGAMFRQPNLWRLGTTVDGTRYDDASILPHIGEQHALTELEAVYDSMNVRERTFVGNVTGKPAAAARYPFNSESGPFWVGFKRQRAWTDTHFQTQRECQVMADLIGIRSLMTYHQDTLTIAAHPGLQIDDQVYLSEAVTSEAGFHYVMSIASDWDVEVGKWPHELTTHWLGTAPYGQWLFDIADLAADTQDYLAGLGVAR